MTEHAAVDVAGPAETERHQSAPVRLTMLRSMAGDSATTDGHCDDGYCAVP